MLGMLPQILTQAPTLGADSSVSFFAVFAAGLLAFFSPCVLPIIPLYMGYLSGNRPAVPEDESAEAKEVEKAKAQVQRTTLLNTVFFVLGISFVYLLMGYAAGSLGQWFQKNGPVISKTGGALVIILGLLQLYSQLRGSVLTRERRLGFDFGKYSMNPLIAFILGFTFSFAWTPCVGPILLSVIAMVANAETKGRGLLLMLVYTLGFTLPLLALGIFTEKVLAFFKKNRHVMKYTSVIGALLMIVIGVLLLLGKLA